MTVIIKVTEWLVSSTKCLGQASPVPQPTQPHTIIHILQMRKLRTSESIAQGYPEISGQLRVESWCFNHYGILFFQSNRPFIELLQKAKRPDLPYLLLQLEVRLCWS